MCNALAAGFSCRTAKLLRISSAGSLVASGYHSKLRPFLGICLFICCFLLLHIFAQAGMNILAFERKITHLLFSAVLTGRSGVTVCKIKRGKRQLG